MMPRTSVEVRAASVGGGVLAKSAYSFTTGRSKKEVRNDEMCRNQGRWLALREDHP
jgi:hypothetical protein